MKDEPNRAWTRRAFLGLSGLAGIAAVSGLYRWRTIGNLRHQAAPNAGGSLDDHSVSTLVALLAALFGITPGPDDERELTDRLRYAAENDGGRLAEYQWLVSYLDRESTRAAAAAYVDVDSSLRDRIMRDAAARDQDWRRQRIRAFFRLDGRHTLRMRRSTLPHLEYLYLNSGVPWRQRGYVSWPGVPDDRLAYTRPLEPRQW